MSDDESEEARRGVDLRGAANRRSKADSQAAAAAQAAASKKRRIGGHFGAAVGSKTSAIRPKASWRDELDEPGSPTPAPLPGGAPAEDDDSESDAIMDPGTPLPSEDEGEQAETNGGAAASKSGGADGPSGAAAAAEDVTAATAGGDGDGGLGWKADVTPSGPGRGLDGPEVLRASEKSVVVTLEVLVGEASCGAFRILLPRGLEANAERRLLRCRQSTAVVKTSEGEGTIVSGVGAGAASEGAQVEAVVAACFCTFAGHGSVPLPSRKAAEDAEAANGAEATPADGHMAIKGHGYAGLLSAPREGEGLVLTLGPMEHLDASHEVLGWVLAGRRAALHLQALAPCTGSPQPRTTASLRAAGPPAEKNELEPAPADEAAGDAAEAAQSTAEGSAAPSPPAAAEASPAPANVVPHPVLLLEPATAKEQASKPFGMEAEEMSPAEVLDAAELELTGRDLEVTEMKQMQFSRERQEGVAALEDALELVGQRLGSLPELEDPTLKGQRDWQQQRMSHLSRVLKKMR
eukprot:TRINITY_DN59042_c0_g1_i2.p1 TRINITY_DN59042_c0_g1~~TRINITY_DN59042_c0_g1_i2.p1  ORF type:complete len:521 (-),score=169.89 TRINITY_DN59042_c0_g1_i2:38-1600(-)